MKQAYIQLLIMIGCFFISWFALSKIDFMSILNVKRMQQVNEEKLGKFIWESMKNSETEIEEDSILAPLNKIKDRLCKANKIDPTQIKIHIIDKEEINAFALPDRHLVFYSGLILNCESAEELTGVMAHEIAHMERSHVMKKLIKEIGLSILINLAGGNAGTEIMKETARVLSSSAYDRSLESEADKFAVTYLMRARIDPEPFANFMYRLSLETNMPEQFYWISTHPESKERSIAITEMYKNKPLKKRPVMKPGEWDSYKELLKPIII